MRFPYGLFACGFLLGVIFIDSIFDYNPNIQFFKAYYSSHFFATLPLNAILPVVLVVGFVYFVFHAIRGSILQILSLIVLILGGGDFALNLLPKQGLVATTTESSTLEVLQHDFRLHHAILAAAVGIITFLQVIFVNMEQKAKQRRQ